MAISLNDIREQFAKINATMEENKELLTQLDSAIGDGDLGLTMTTGFAAIVKFFEGDVGPDIGKTLMQAGMAMNNAASSTMGTLLSSAILRMGQTVRNKTELDEADLVEMFNAGINGTQERGKAEVGDKTILDALVPAVEAFAASIEKGEGTKEAFSQAAIAAEQGFDGTAEMVSKHGRGHYYGEKSRGHKDPGAAVGMLIFQALRD